MNAVRELAGAASDAMSDERLRDTQPWVQRGLVAHWPMVQAARRSTADAMAYLKSTWRGERVGMLIAPPEARGRFFYNDAFTGMNFGRETAPLDVVLDALAKMADDPQAPAVYVGSTSIDATLKFYNLNPNPKYVRITSHLAPSSNKTVAPTLSSWDMQMDCQPSE